MDTILLRMKNLNDLKEHPWISKLFGKINQKDMDFLIYEIEESDGLDTDQWESRINRLFIDNPNKPKRWKELSEILSSINSRTKRKSSEDHLNHSPRRGNSGKRMA